MKSNTDCKVKLRKVAALLYWVRLPSASLHLTPRVLFVVVGDPLDNLEGGLWRQAFKLVSYVRMPDKLS